MKKNIIFLAALVCVCGVNPALAQSKKQAIDVSVTSCASEKTLGGKLSLEQLVQKGIEKVNAGKIQEAEDLFAQASALVEVQ